MPFAIADVPFPSTVILKDIVRKLDVATQRKVVEGELGEMRRKWRMEEGRSGRRAGSPNVCACLSVCLCVTDHQDLEQAMAPGHVGTVPLRHVCARNLALALASFTRSNHLCPPPGTRWKTRNEVGSWIECWSSLKKSMPFCASTKSDCIVMGCLRRRRRGKLE